MVLVSLLIWRVTHDELLYFYARCNIGVESRARILGCAIAQRYPDLLHHWRLAFEYQQFHDSKRTASSGYVSVLDSVSRDGLHFPAWYIFDVDLVLVGILQSGDGRMSRPLEYDGSTEREVLFSYQTFLGSRYFACTAVIELGVQQHTVRAFACEPVGNKGGYRAAIWDFRARTQVADLIFANPIRGRLAVCGALRWIAPGQMEQLGHFPGRVWLAPRNHDVLVPADQPIEQSLSWIMIELFPGRGNWY